MTNFTEECQKAISIMEFLFAHQTEGYKKYCEKFPTIPMEKIIEHFLLVVIRFFESERVEMKTIREKLMEATKIGGIFED